MHDALVIQCRRDLASSPKTMSLLRPRLGIVIAAFPTCLSREADSMLLRTLFLMVLCSLPMQVGATTYYVRTDGNDANAGTTNSTGGAFKTIRRCVGGSSVTGAMTTPGDTCRVQDGTYVETNALAFFNSGTAGARITLMAEHQ